MPGLSPILLLSAMLAAPGEIHRCVDQDGSVSFQDRVCAAGQQASSLTGAGLEPDQQALRAWLDALRGRGPEPPSSRPSARTPSAPASRRVVPERDDSMRYAAVSEYALAICSEQFLRCADADMQRMDACVAALPRCTGASREGCCPEACVHRYQLERRGGHSLPTAVRLALLDPQASHCASPPAP